MEKRKVVATWTGKYPCLCMGEWKLYVDGKDYSEAIPKDYRTESMGTYGAYKEWRFRDGMWNGQAIQMGLARTTGFVKTRRGLTVSRQTPEISTTLFRHRTSAWGPAAAAFNREDEA